jgi:hypothetical protein
MSLAAFFEPGSTEKRTWLPGMSRCKSFSQQCNFNGCMLKKGREKNTTLSWRVSLYLPCCGTPPTAGVYMRPPFALEKSSIVKVIRHENEKPKTKFCVLAARLSSSGGRCQSASRCQKVRAASTRHRRNQRALGSRGNCQMLPSSLRWQFAGRRGMAQPRRWGGRTMASHSR